MSSFEFERLPIKIFQNQKSGCKQAAQVFQKLIAQNNAAGKNTVIGMATGSSPISFYNQLIRMHKQQGLSFKNVVTFNLDEYYPISPIASQSYVRYMKQNLFDHIDIDFEKNVNIPDGTIPLNQVKAFCDDYQERIKKAGGIDIQLLGIGRNGHIGFNEPNSHETSTTRLITLAMTTKEDASEDFGGLSLVPHRAITMGIRSIMKAKQIILLAWGSNKMEAVYKMAEKPPTEDVPSSLLQKHDNVQVYIDHNASQSLTRVSRPWLVRDCEWTIELIKTAVIMLSLKQNVPILQLTEQHYNFNGLSQLLAQFNSHEDINIKVFNILERTITGWPGGKPNVDDSKRPERALPTSKRVIVFSPHPDDDVISMGGTLFKLQKQGHDVHVCYQTSGSNSVFDDEAIKLLNFTKSFGKTFEQSPDLNCDDILKAINQKKPGQRDVKAVKEVKRMIRQQQAKAALRFGKFKPQNIHFLKMPFYETGVTHKADVNQQDLQKVRDLICKIQPHSIFMAGDLADPHGTHRKCTQTIQDVVCKLKAQYAQKKENEFIQNCWVWMYKGAWQEWAPYEILMAVPLSPDQVIEKRKAIFYHQSQKDMVMFRGDDNRQFWERAEQRNATTANIYRNLGLASYAAIQAFARFYF